MTLKSRLGRRLRAAGVVAPREFTPTQLEQLRAVVREAVQSEVGAPAPEAVSDFNILDVYCGEPPSPQTAADIFAGEWTSQFPAPLQDVTGGTTNLFETELIPWGVDVLGGVKEQRVVELGPLEAGHTYTLDRLGAAEVVAIEANARAYLKCLVAKELLDISSAHFLHGDAIRYLEGQIANGAQPFDLCLASGVLYHLMNPVAALDVIAKSSDRLLLWTMYYDRAVIEGNPALAAKFPTEEQVDYQGFRHTVYRQEYQSALAFKGFCGGSAVTSSWLSRDTILEALDRFGFEPVQIGFEGVTSNGPCFAVAARRRA